MTDIELVIKIPKEMYDIACNYPEMVLAGYSQCIKNGIVLPKGHGDLIDKSKIKTVELEDSLYYLQWKQDSEIDLRIDAETIIEADKMQGEKI